MKAIDVPLKLDIPFGDDADPGTIRVVPVTPPVQVGAASLETGFGPVNMLPIGAGGVPPFGQDMNGILNAATAWARWFSAGAPLYYDSAFSTAIGGYPAGALLQSDTYSGYFYLCTADDNTADPDSALVVAGWLPFSVQTLPQTGGYLRYDNNNSITLAPSCGGMLWIKGRNYPIPAALSIPHGSLPAFTFRYIFAFMNGANMNIELGATGYTFNANGIPQKAGDDSRTLVGAIQLDGNGSFLPQGYGTLSYFNRKNINLLNTSTGVPWTNAVLAEINTAMRLQFICWNDEAVSGSIGGTWNNSVTGGVCTFQPRIDGSAALIGDVQQCQEFAATAGSPFMCMQAQSLADGPHYQSLFAAVTTGAQGNLQNCYTRILLRG